MNTENHAFTQAAAQYSSIVAFVAAIECDYDRLEELRDEREELASAAEDPESEDETAEAIESLAQWDEDNAEELNDLKHAAGEFFDRNEATEAAQENALSVEVRSGWTSCGDTMTPEEFRIVLCTGGPAVQIRGELNEYKEPSRAWLEYQDWGTPWTQYFPASQDTLLTYCAAFYFGN
jgi:hypothetical protein